MGGGVLSHRLVCATVGAGSLDETGIRELGKKVKHYPSELISADFLISDILPCLILTDL